MTSVSRPASTLTIDELLTLALTQRNAASSHEIIRRQIAEVPAKSMPDFVYAELAKTRQVKAREATTGVATAAPTVAADGVDDIYALANEMLNYDPPFEGQSMKDPDNASDYIHIAADNPRVSDEMPEQGFRFWQAAKFHFQKWKARQERLTRAGG